MSRFSLDEVKTLFRENYGLLDRHREAIAMAGFLSLEELKAVPKAAVRTAIIAGGPAGDRTVSGIAVGDALRSVHSLDMAQADHAAQAHVGAAVPDHAAQAHAGAGVSSHAAEVLTGVDLDAVKADHAVAARHPDHTVTQPNDHPVLTHTVTQPTSHPALAHTRTWSRADLTGEFSITAANTINNAGSTDTTGAVLVVVWEDLTP